MMKQTGSTSPNKPKIPQISTQHLISKDSSTLLSSFIFLVTAVLFSLICVCVSIFLILSWSDVQDEGTLERLTSTYLHVPLTEPFSLNFEEVLRIRDHNMKLYPYEYAYKRGDIDRRTNLSLQEFRDVYDGKWPVILQDVVPTWGASNWSHQSLCDEFGLEKVVMKAAEGGLDRATSFSVPLEIFCSHTEEFSFHYWTYIEDELFIPMRPKLRNKIGKMVPGDDDFFQLFPDEVRPWDSMLLWGTKFSRSALHIDPYNWTGTNAVISGLKHWRLFPPGQDHLLNVLPNFKSYFPLNCYKYNSPIDAYNVDDAKFPEFKNAEFIEFSQYPGELLIIPSGWFHQALNMKETIAISSQFMNINNYRIVLEEILKIGNVERNLLPSDISTLTPAEQVKVVMSMLPQHIKDRGRQVTQYLLNQIVRENPNPHEEENPNPHDQMAGEIPNPNLDSKTEL